MSYSEFHEIWRKCLASKTSAKSNEPKKRSPTDGASQNNQNLDEESKDKAVPNSHKERRKKR
jgi:hypothetical protein